MTNDDNNAFKEFPSLCPPVVATTATRHRRHRPPHVDQGFLLVSPKMVPIADTSDTAVALAVGDDRQQGGEGGQGGEWGGGSSSLPPNRRRRMAGQGSRGGSSDTASLIFFLSRDTYMPRRRPNDDDALRPQHPRFRGRVRQWNLGSPAFRM
jgi:hypothetical protein